MLNSKSNTNFDFIDELCEIKITKDILNAVYPKMIDAEKKPIIITSSPVGHTTMFLDMYKNFLNETTNVEDQ